MNALIKNELRLSRRHLLIWLGLVFLLGFFTFFEYLSLKDSLTELAEMMDSYPKILKVTFGIEERLDTALGWYGCIYYWVTILTYSYAVHLGVSCVGREKVRGTSEYLFTKPVSRGQIFMAKTLAGVCNLFVLTLLSGAADYVFFILPLGGLEQRGAVITTTIGMFLTEVVLFALALLVSSLAGTYQSSVRLGAVLLLGFYGIYVMAGYLELPSLYYLTPLKYFDVYAVAREGFGVIFLLISAAIVAVSVSAARRRWTCREL